MKIKSIIIGRASKAWFACISEVAATDLGQLNSPYGFIKMIEDEPTFIPKEEVDFNDLDIYFDSFKDAFSAADRWILINIPKDEQ